MESAAVTLAPPRGQHKDYRVELAGESEIDKRPAVDLKIIGQDGRAFTMSFDKEIGLPVRRVRRRLARGIELTETTTFRDFKDFDGLMVATNRTDEVHRPGGSEPAKDASGQTRPQLTLTLFTTITDFKVLDEVDPKTFAKPE